MAKKKQEPVVEPCPTEPVVEPCPTRGDSESLRAATMELARRRIEALKLYEPLPIQNAFHMSKVRSRLIRGSNRSGKTLCAAIELVRAVTGQDPYGKYPKENGRAYVVAKDLKAVSEVIWTKLVKANPKFRIIRDKQTGEWRSWRPWDMYDEERERETKMMPPLLPPRFIKSVAYYKKALDQPSFVKLRNGWEISFFSSMGRPPHGMDIDLVWFDEEIIDHTWYPEMMARLLDREGRFFWSATPQAGTEQLFELHEKAEKQRHDSEPDVAEFVTLLADNAFMTEKAKRYFINSIDDEQYRVRVAGEFSITSFRVFPEWSEAQHTVDWFEVPPHWTRYAAIDPGHDVCGVLFCAMPPPNGKDQHEGDFIYVYDELYLKHCNADIFGEAMAKKAEHQQFQAFVIDQRMARHTELGLGKTVHVQYTEALRKYKVRSAMTGCDFFLGMDDKEAGVLAIHGLLRARDNGTPRLRVMRESCPNFCWEMKRIYRKSEDGKPTNKISTKTGNHLVDGLRYIIGMDPVYVPPRKQKPKLVGALAAWERKQKKRKENGEGSYVRFGPGALTFNK